jgi:transcriptional regulator with XRE-family HTH domain
MNTIKEILETQGRSQAWLAKQLGKSYVVVTNYCNNKTQPSILVLNSIAIALDVDVRTLLVSTVPILAIRNGMKKPKGK